MTLSAIDWPNIVATLTAACLGGLIAAHVAKRQIDAAQRVDFDRTRRDTARELIEAIDSFLHIAYRGEQPVDKLERQRLRRRILSLTALVMSGRFNAVQDHLNLVDRWWGQRRGGPRVAGAGFTATETFFTELKEGIFLEVFGTRVHLTATPDPMQTEGDGLPF